MKYRAVGKRCAVNLNDLRLPVSNQEALEILARKGFSIINVNMTRIARNCIGSSQYRRGARLGEAPTFFDCSGFVKWLYGLKGIWLPRRSIQQSECGHEVHLEYIKSGDLVFTSGAIDYYRENPEEGVGHVGIATSKKTVIHAANKNVNIVETALKEFTNEVDFRGIRRILPRRTKIITLQVPESRDVEVSDDIRWIILQSLPKLR